MPNHEIITTTPKDGTLSRETLTIEAKRLMGAMKDALRDLPEFQKATAGIFLDTPTSEGLFHKRVLSIQDISFEKDGNIYQVHRIPELENGKSYHDSEKLSVQRKTKEGISTFVKVEFKNNSYESIMVTETAPSKNSEGSRHELKRENNTKAAIKMADKFIKELSSPTTSVS